MDLTPCRSRLAPGEQDAGPRSHLLRSLLLHGRSALLEERYERLDDGSQLNHAHLKKVWQLAWGTEDAASTVLPGDGGIHRMGNPGNGMAISVHLYGPRMDGPDGRDYDPSRDYVCDRFEG
jgi:hypothetical protein